MQELECHVRLLQDMLLQAIADGQSKDVPILRETYTLSGKNRTFSLNV